MRYNIVNVTIYIFSVATRISPVCEQQHIDPEPKDVIVPDAIAKGKETYNAMATNTITKNSET